MTTSNRASLSTIGPYAAQVTVIAEVSEWLRERNANVTAVYSVKLGGNYGSHFLFVADVLAMARIREQWRPDLEHRFGAYFRDDETNVDSAHHAVVYDIAIQGPDRQGIVADVSRCAAASGADILATSAMASVSTARRGAFVLQMKLALPDTDGFPDLLRGLEKLASHDGWHVTVQSVQFPRPPSHATTQARGTLHRLTNYAGTTTN